MPYLQYYRKALLYGVKWIALLISIVSTLLFILILADLLFGLRWGYPWWSALAAFGLIAISLAIRQAARTALRQMRET